MKTNLDENFNIANQDKENIRLLLVHKYLLRAMMVEEAESCVAKNISKEFQYNGPLSSD